MPQFDKITFFNQIFWLIVTFSIFYFFILKNLLPALASGLKTRKKFMALLLSSVGLVSESSSSKSYSKNLHKFSKNHLTLLSGLSSKQLAHSEASKMKILGSSFF